MVGGLSCFLCRTAKSACGRKTSFLKYILSTRLSAGDFGNRHSPVFLQDLMVQYHYTAVEETSVCFWKKQTNKQTIVLNSDVLGDTH